MDGHVNVMEAVCQFTKPIVIRERMFKYINVLLCPVHHLSYMLSLLAGIRANPRPRRNPRRRSPSTAIEGVSLVLEGVNAAAGSTIRWWDIDSFCPHDHWGGLVGVIEGWDGAIIGPAKVVRC